MSCTLRSSADCVAYRSYGSRIEDACAGVRLSLPRHRDVASSVVRVSVICAPAAGSSYGPSRPMHPHVRSRIDFDWRCVSRLAPSHTSATIGGRGELANCFTITTAAEGVHTASWTSATRRAGGSSSSIIATRAAAGGASADPASAELAGGQASSSSRNSSSNGSSRRVKMTGRGIVWEDDPVEQMLQQARDVLGAWHGDMVVWRRAIHAHPELAFQEEKTSDLVASLLEEWGYEVDCSLGSTGIVGTLTRNCEQEVDAGREDHSGQTAAIMLRADMDALPIEEHNTFAHRSQRPQTMHACGHDGHTAMLLGAARYLAESGRFKGQVHLVFQPAEEGTPTDNKDGRVGGGALAMLDDGLLEKYPVKAAYGMHNWPGLPVGRIAVHSGPVMAGVDNFDIVVTGEGCHAGMPHLGAGRDAVLCAAHIVTQLQTLVSRLVDPQDSAVVSVTQLHAGDAYNVIPPQAVIKGTIRTFSKTTRASVMDGMTRIATSVAAAHGCTAAVAFRDFFPATVNTAAEASQCARVAAAVVGEHGVDFDTRTPSMGAEDFGYILERVPGCYVWIGNGPTEGGCMLHNPLYDFNDEILPLGAMYWVKLVEALLPCD